VLGDNHIALELDGDGVSPTSVDTVQFTRLAAAYFNLLDRIASQQGFSLKIEGIGIQDKCVALVGSASHADAAKEVTTVAASYINGSTSIPRGLRSDAEQLQQILRELPETQRVRVLVGNDWCQNLTQQSEEQSLPPLEWLALRVTLMRVGGATPAIRCASIFEEQQFTLTATRDLVQNLGPHVYKEIEIDACVQRDLDGRIREGAVVNFRLLDDEDATEAWKSWYAANASFWDEVSDIEVKLGRSDSHD